MFDTYVMLFIIILASRIFALFGNGGVNLERDFNTARVFEMFSA